MAIFQGDVLIRESILLGLEDIRKNPWLIDDILSCFTSNVYLKAKYSKQVEACKEWFLNNNIEVIMDMRTDSDRLPCVTINMGPSNEKGEMKTMADLSTETVALMPNTIGKPIPYVIKPFAVLSYDPDTGEAEVDPSVATLQGVSAGMILVNPLTGIGYVVVDIYSGGVVLQVDLEDFQITNYGIVPKYQYYEARIEHTFMNETYTIGCHTHGDPQTLLWLHSIVLTSILRYRESLLEANGFAESSVSSSPLLRNPNFQGPGGEAAYTRTITLTGQVENTWIKTPRRFVEAVELKQTTPEGVTGGIKILSNGDASEFLDITKETWSTVDDTNGQYDSGSES